jgi:hypothetical protein
MVGSMLFEEARHQKNEPKQLPELGDQNDERAFVGVLAEEPRSCLGRDGMHCRTPAHRRRVWEFQAPVPSLSSPCQSHHRRIGSLG